MKTIARQTRIKWPGMCVLSDFSTTRNFKVATPTVQRTKVRIPNKMNNGKCTYIRSGDDQARLAVNVINLGS